MPEHYQPPERETGPGAPNPVEDAVNELMLTRAWRAFIEQRPENKLIATWILVHTGLINFGSAVHANFDDLSPHLITIALARASADGLRMFLSAFVEGGVYNGTKDRLGKIGPWLAPLTTPAIATALAVIVNASPALARGLGLPFELPETWQHPNLEAALGPSILASTANGFSKPLFDRKDEITERLLLAAFGEIIISMNRMNELALQAIVIEPARRRED